MSRRYHTDSQISIAPNFGWWSLVVGLITQGLITHTPSSPSLQKEDLFKPEFRLNALIFLSGIVSQDVINYID